MSNHIANSDFLQEDNHYAHEGISDLITQQVSMSHMAKVILLEEEVNNVKARYTEPYLHHRGLERKACNRHVGVVLTYFDINLLHGQTVFFPTVQKFINQYERKLLEIEIVYTKLDEMETEAIEAYRHACRTRKNHTIPSCNIPEIDINDDEIPF